MAHRLLVFGLLLILATGFATQWQVDNALTEEDVVYINKYLRDGNVQPLPSAPSYTDELKFIQSVQRAVLAVVHGNIRTYRVGGVEPKDLYMAKSSLCYGRSRVIEKILRFEGFRTRHIALYSTEATGSAIRSLLTRRVPSHAITEVLTSEGWLVVDSNDPWLSLDRRNRPVELSKIAADAATHEIQWNPHYLPVMNHIYRKPFTFVYGLYSRHGLFYPPYGILPDVSYRELLYNFLPVRPASALS